MAINTHRLTALALLFAAACDSSPTAKTTPTVPAQVSPQPPAPDTAALLRDYERRARDVPVPELADMKRKELISELRSLQISGFNKPEYKAGDKASAEACGAAMLELLPKATALVQKAAILGDPSVLEAANYAHQCVSCELGIRMCVRADEALDVLQR